MKTLKDQIQEFVKEGQEIINEHPGINEIEYTIRDADYYELIKLDPNPSFHATIKKFLSIQYFDKIQINIFTTEYEVETPKPVMK